MANSTSREARISAAMARVARKERWHVIPAESRWVVIREGAQRATRRLPSQRDAIALARSLAQSSGAEVIVHGKNGRIRERFVVADGPLGTVYPHGGDPK
jgi:hypothetical protein